MLNFQRRLDAAETALADALNRHTKQVEQLSHDFQASDDHLFVFESYLDDKIDSLSDRLPVVYTPVAPTAVADDVPDGAGGGIGSVFGSDSNGALMSWWRQSPTPVFPRVDDAPSPFCKGAADAPTDSSSASTHELNFCHMETRGMRNNVTVEYVNSPSLDVLATVSRLPNKRHVASAGPPVNEERAAQYLKELEHESLPKYAVFARVNAS